MNAKQTVIEVCRFRALEERLKSSRGWVRKEAVSELPAFKHPDALRHPDTWEPICPSTLERLGAALQDRSQEVRRAAVIALGKIPCRKVIKPLLSALEDKSAKVRNAAARALLSLHNTSERHWLRWDSELLEPLAAALCAHSELVRRTAAEVIEKIPCYLGIENPELYQPAAAALKDESEKVRNAGLLILCGLNDPRAVRELIQQLASGESEALRSRAAQALGKRRDNKEACEALAAALADSSGEVRYAAAEALAKLGDERALQLLTEEFLTGTRPRDAFQALCGIEDARSFETLCTALRHDDPFIRCRAAEALGNIGEDRAVEPLTAALQDEDRYVRGSAAKALGVEKFGDARAVESLITALQDEVEDVREDAARSLGKLGDLRAVEPLCDCLRACPAFGVIDALTELDDYRAIAPLIEVLEQDVDFFSNKAAEALGEIGDARVIAPLTAMLLHNNSSRRTAVKKALRRLVERNVLELPIAALQDEDQELRANAVRVLGAAGDLRAARALIAALKDEEPWMRCEAAKALKVLHEHLGELSFISGSKEAALDVLLESVKELAAALADESAEVPLAADSALQGTSDGPTPVFYRMLEELGLGKPQREAVNA